MRNELRKSSPEVLKQISTEVIDELRDLKERGTVIQGRLVKLDEVGADATKAVADRVREDYNGQLVELSRTAAPLKQKARKEFQKLAELLESVGAVCRSLEQDKEEIELRNQLGEFDDKEFEKKVGEVKTALGKHQEELAQMDSMRESFISVFDSEKDLSDSSQAPPPPPPVAPPQAREISPPKIKAPKVESSEVKSPEAKDNKPEIESVPQVDDPSAVDKFAGTVLLNNDLVKEVLSGDIGGTSVLPMSMARLEPVEESDAPKQPIHLGPRTVIGRTADNQLQIDQGVVSRRHAEIAQLEDGYRLRDLKSENGTYVNGDAIEEVVLSDGDRIQIGSHRYVFRTT